MADSGQRSRFENDLGKVSDGCRDFLAKTHGLLIDGRVVESAGGRWLDVIDPTSGRVVSRAPAGTAEDVDRAVAAARRAFDDGPWRRFKPNERERRIHKLADLLEARAALFSEIETVNTGRTLPTTRMLDVDFSVDCLRYMAGWCSKIHGETFSPSTPYAPGARFFSFSLREPVGVVGAITPWNVPLGQAIWKIAPALATGCTIVLKPAEQTPLTALLLGALAAEADIPDGVINIVTGYGAEAGAALVNHPGVDKIAFTGSTATGRVVAQTAASKIVPYTLEMGGKSPMIVFDDADLEYTIQGAAWAIFGNHGQNCCAGSRLYVQDAIFDEVVAGVARIASSIALGSPLDPETQMGPLVSAAQQRRVLDYIEAGKAEGAEIAAGGARVGESGCYVAPTVLVGTAQNARVVQEEIFGPVLCAMRFSELEEAVAKANDTAYGLTASVWTRDIDKALKLIPAINAGTVWINTHNILDVAVPFGGFKASGIGYELGGEAIKHHTKSKTVTMAAR